MKKFISFALFFLAIFSMYSQASFDVDKKLLNQRVLGILCDDELSKLRNEIYAHHGYVFSNSDIQAYFEEMPWYSRVSDNNSIRLSDIEQQNIVILKKEEDAREKRTSEIKNYFKVIKNRTIGYQKFIDPSIKLQERFSVFDILDKIDINQMSFCGANGLYEVTVDNGFSQISYFLRVIGDRILLGRQSYGASSIFPESERIKEGDDDFVAQKRVGEYTDCFIFEIDDDNKISYLEVGGAG